MANAPAGAGLRLLFGSYHCALDPFSGAALSVRDLFTLLVPRGHVCRAFCGPHLDAPHHLPIASLLRDPRYAALVGHRCRQTEYAAALVPFTRFDLTPGGIPFTILDTPGARPGQPPTPAEGRVFLALFEQTLDEFRPDLLLTYGGHRFQVELMAAARRRGIRVVFWLHNFAYTEAALFRDVDAILVPSPNSAEHYRRLLGRDCTALPPPLDWTLARCDEVQGRYVTFVNPDPNKGVYPFARIALELAQRRPDIPLLVVQGRGDVAWLKAAGLDFDALGNLNFLATTPDPRDFYRVTRALVVPSLWREAFGRVAAEAMLNGIPVLSSRRGGLPETLADAGFLLDIPEAYTPQTRTLPTAAEMAPWLETIIRLWDEEAFHASESRRALAAAEAWRPDRLAPRYESFFAGLLGKSPPPILPGPETVPAPPAHVSAPTGPTPEGPAVSVIMPVHNGAAFVERAICSVRAQTFADWELLVTDDGSTDDSSERVCRLAALDPRIRPLRLPENRGESAARNAALRQARAPLIAYLDCDDEYYPDYLARAHAWRGQADVLVCGYDLLDERPDAPNFGRLTPYDPVPFRALLAQGNIITPLGVSHHRVLFDRVGLFDEGRHFEADWDLWKRFQAAGAIFLFSDRKSGIYHIRPHSQARTRRIPDAARPAGPSPTG